MGRRVGLLVAAALVALIGTSAVFAYVSRVESKALAEQEPVDVLVAAAQIPEGMAAGVALQQKLVRVETLPQSSVPEGALTSLKEVTTQSAMSDIFPGEVLLRPKFADRTARTGNLVIPDDKIAISVQLGDPQRVAGFVVPGSEVAVFDTVDAASASVTGTASATQTGNTTNAKVDLQATVDTKVTRLLLPRTTVIAVGPATLRPTTEEPEAKEGESTTPTAILTLALTQAEAEKIVHATQTGDLYFGLLSTKSKVAPSQGVTNSTLFK